MNEGTETHFNINLREELHRLASFGANLADAHSCFFFFPTSFITMLAKGSSTVPKTDRTLRVTACHTLSDAVQINAAVETGSGLIGWVAQNAQPIHVSPFERDSRTLRIYSQDVGLKSFMAVPIIFHRSTETNLIGVLACDSKKSFAFSKLQGKLLEQLAEQVASISKLALLACRSVAEPTGWVEFLDSAHALMETLGNRSVELLRVRPSNLDELEQTLGMRAAEDLFLQIARLIEQVLPPPRPAYRLHQGDILLLVDSMMSAFYQNKIHALCEHVSPPGCKVRFEFSKFGAREVGKREYTLDDLLRASSTAPRTTENVKGVAHERRRA